MDGYSSTVIVLLAVTGVCGILCVIFWFVFHIPHIFYLLTGIGAKREIRKMTAEKHGMQTPSAGMLFAETTILPEERETTTVLSEEEIIKSSIEQRNLSLKETGLLLEKDVVIRGDDRNI